MRRWLLPLISLCLLTTLTTLPAAQADQSVYTDSLQNSWVNYSWATVNLSCTSPVHTGTDSISVDAGGYQALYVHHTAFDDTSYTNIVFWINGGAAGGQTFQVAATLNGTAQASYTLPALTANTWTQVTIPLSTLGVAGTTSFDGFWIQSTSSNTQPTCYVDDISLTGGPPPVNPGLITVDAATNRHPISPQVYGVAFGSTAQLLDLNSPVNRSGGNGMTTYNWLQNADNHAADWYFESIGENGSTPGQLVDSFVSDSKAAGAQSAITIPTIGWVAKLGPNRATLPSFSVAKYGAQQKADPYDTDAGNGVETDGVTNITGNDPNDANVPSDVNFQGAWIDHLVATWGKASTGGVTYYLMDNEPSIWFGTHRDIHPIGPKMGEILTDIETYGGRVKSADPSAQIVGPEEWGWSGYFYSGYDQQYAQAHNYQDYPDRDANGGMDIYPWLLQQLAAHDQTTGQRSLDVLSAHLYPDGNEFTSAVDDATELLRNRSTREFWDPNYTSTGWINSQVMLIPRLKNWVSTYYPGTKVAITEYNWGAEPYINGATTQADIDGILGREGLDLATRWTTPDPSTPTYKAMKMYRNYDGNKSTFGDTSVSDTAPAADSVSSFAAVRAKDGALTVMVINKQLYSAAPISLTLKNFVPGGAAQTWQLTSANAITQLASTAISSGVLTATVPAQSITLYVVPAATVPAAPTNLTAVAAPGKVSLSWMASPGTVTSYSLYRGTAPGTETFYKTALAATYFVNTYVTNGTTYYYTVKALNANGTSTASNEVSATPALIVPPAAPTNLTAVAAPGKVSLSWMASPGTVTSYSLYRGTAPGTETFYKTALAATYFVNTYVTNGTTYYYTVKALNANGTSTASNEVSATPALAVPPAPTNLTAVAAPGKVSLSWTASPGTVTSYSLYRGTAPGTETFYKTALAATYFVNTYVTNGTTYYYTVKALNANGTSTASNEVSGTP